MSKIHYFQRYSQKENVVTNNTLLLFSRLYNDNPSRFETFINSLLTDDRVDIEIGLRFRQQNANRAGNSVPDGSIVQKSMKVLIETKLYDNNDSKQILDHLAGFGHEDGQVMLLINAEAPRQTFITKVNQLVANYNIDNNKHIEFCSVTFKEIITAFAEIIPEHNSEFIDILEDYKEFCHNENLLPRNHLEMRAITSGGSFNQNMTYNIYYDQAHRGYRNHQYMGLYKNKAIKAVGKLSKIVLVNVDQATNKIVSRKVKLGDEPTQQELADIINIMHAAYDENGWNVFKDHQFFIVEKFHETNYKKTTKYPIQRTKYFDLGDILNQQDLPEGKQLAEQLSEQTWE